MTEEQARVPKLRFPGFADAWEQRKLGDVVQLTGGGTPSKANPSFWNGDIVWLSSQEIKGRFTDHGTYKISQEAVKRSAAKMVQVGTPLIVYRSGILAHSFPITRPTVVVAINQDIKALLFDRSELNTQFVVSQLESKEEYILRNIVKTGTTVQSVNIPDFVRMPFSVPNVDEQSELAEFFASLDDLIALHQRKLSHLGLLKKGLLQKMFPKPGEAYPEIRFPGFADAWEQRKLGELVDVRSGQDYKHLSVGDIPVYGTGGYMLGVDRALSYSEDAIGIGRKGTIDKPYVLHAPFWTVDTLFYAVPRDGNDLGFLYSTFERVDWRGKDESTGVPSLSKKTINDVTVASPSAVEQRQIGAFFASLDDLIALHQRKLTHLQQQKKALLQQMFV
jgi:type I restriction enzyme S subunit